MNNSKNVKFKKDMKSTSRNFNMDRFCNAYLQLKCQFYKYFSKVLVQVVKLLVSF